MTLAELLSDLRLLVTRGPWCHPTRPELVRAAEVEHRGAHLVELGWAERARESASQYIIVSDDGLDMFEWTRDIVLPET